MTKLPVVSGRECVRALQKIGFVVDRQKGSHITLIRESPYSRVTVPNHKTIKPGILRSIIRQAGITVEQFNQLL